MTFSVVILKAYLRQALCLNCVLKQRPWWKTATDDDPKWIKTFVGLGSLGIMFLSQKYKVGGLKPGCHRWIFQDIKVLGTNPPEGILNRRCRVWYFRPVEEPQFWENRHRYYHRWGHCCPIQSSGKMFWFFQRSFGRSSSRFPFGFLFVFPKLILKIWFLSLF